MVVRSGNNFVLTGGGGYTKGEMSAVYIVAVSGGVDSVVMLDRLVRADEARLIVAHVDHGIRAESGEDAEFVAELAAKYGLSYESVQLQLGAEASEAEAREKRWEYLRTLKTRYRADVIVTAHHADDVVETMIINLLRGTGWRGIASLVETDEIKRPLLHERKRDIINYARQRSLKWHEDATNQDPKYLRNYVRHSILASCSDEQFATFLSLHDKQADLRKEIEREVAEQNIALSRYQLTMLPDEVAREVVRYQLGSVTKQESDRILLFARTAKLHKDLRLSSNVTLRTSADSLIVLGSQG